jgi:hypothetical protein
VQQLQILCLEPDGVSYLVLFRWCSRLCCQFSDGGDCSLLVLFEESHAFLCRLIAGPVVISQREGGLMSPEDLIG